MRINIADEIKFSHVAVGDYLVVLRDPDQTVIGEVVRIDNTDDWKVFDTDKIFLGVHRSRKDGAHKLLLAYELANGLRDNDGRRVMRELDTNLWYVAEFTGVRRSKRWQDRADAVAHLAEIQETNFEDIGRQAARDDESGAPAHNRRVSAALKDRKVGDPASIRIMKAFTRGYQSVRDEQAQAVLAEPVEDNEAAEPTPLTYHVRINSDGTVVSKSFSTFEEAARICRAFNTDNPGGLYSVYDSNAIKVEAADDAMDTQRCTDMGGHLRSSRHTAAECPVEQAEKAAEEEQPEVLSIATVTSLSAIIEAAIHGRTVARLLPKTEQVAVGTARSIGDRDGSRLDSQTDVRDAYLRVTLKTGFDTFWPVMDLVAQERTGEFISNYKEA